jgi:hypothetical protein
MNLSLKAVESLVQRAKSNLEKKIGWWRRMNHKISSNLMSKIC